MTSFFGVNRVDKLGVCIALSLQCLMQARHVMLFLAFLHHLYIEKRKDEWKEIFFYDMTVETLNWKGRFVWTLEWNETCKLVSLTLTNPHGVSPFAFSFYRDMHGTVQRVYSFSFLFFFNGNVCIPIWSTIFSRVNRILWIQGWHS